LVESQALGRLSARDSIDRLQEDLEYYTVNPAVTLALYLEEEQRSIPVLKDDPVLGLANAPHLLVIFSDYRCPSCRELDRTLRKEILPEAGSRLRLVVKQRPLLRDRDAATGDLTWEASWLAARAAVAARSLGGDEAFWKIHDGLMGASTDLTWDQVTGLAKAAGLDPEVLKHEMRLPCTEERIRRDIAVLEPLKINWVPVVFLDNRRVANWRVPGFWQQVVARPRPVP
jgi:protein-disulfide isomerase